MSESVTQSILRNDRNHGGSASLTYLISKDKNVFLFISFSKWHYIAHSRIEQPKKTRERKSKRREIAVSE